VVCFMGSWVGRAGEAGGCTEGAAGLSHCYIVSLFKYFCLYFSFLRLDVSFLFFVRGRVILVS